MGAVEASGKTVEEAIEKALAELGAVRDEVDVEVLQEGRGGMLGRGAQARVRVRLLDDEDDADDIDEDEVDEVEVDEVEADEADADEEDADEDADDAGVEADEYGAAETGVARESADGDEDEGEYEEDEAEFAAQMLDKMLELMGVQADVSIRDAETPGDGVGMAKAVLDVEGDDLGILIGRRGETLTSLQYLLNVMVARQLGENQFFTVDVEGYRRRRERQLTGLAKRMAEQVKRTKRPVELEPMPANERRIIHLALSNDRYVKTESAGEGEDRAVTILLRKQQV